MCRFLCKIITLLPMVGMQNLAYADAFDAQVSDDAIAKLVACGYNQSLATRALRTCRNDLATAKYYLRRQQHELWQTKKKLSPNALLLLLLHWSVCSVYYELFICKFLLYLLSRGVKSYGQMGFYCNHWIFTGVPTSPSDSILVPHAGSSITSTRQCSTWKTGESLF